MERADMTRAQIAAGLEAMIDRLANAPDTPPAGLQAHEWAYVKGIASAEIMRLKERLEASGAKVS
jgi:hypothetical protein